MIEWDGDVDLDCEDCVCCTASGCGFAGDCDDTMCPCVTQLDKEIGVDDGED